MSAPTRTTPSLQPVEDFDWWAIRVVVREGVYMPLRSGERRLAAILMRNKGVPGDEIARRMRITRMAATQLIQRGSPFPVEDVDPSVIGPKWMYKSRSTGMPDGYLSR